MVQKCTHHWDIETTNAPVARGECRKCGAKTTFINGRQQGLTYREEGTLMFNPDKLMEFLPDFKRPKLEQGSRLR